MYGIIAALVAIGVAIAAVSSSVDDDAALSPVLNEPPTDVSGDATSPVDVDSDVMMVEVGVLLPVTGDLASYGVDTKYGLEMALEHFNAYLDENGADWRMSLTIEDTQTDPIIALEKTQSLDGKGIKYILGPSSSSEIRNIMAYVNSNNMLLISPSSTSPKLAIPDDNIFRFVPDDRNQGGVIAALLADRGINSVVIIYRGDIWGDGLAETTQVAFEASGGHVDELIRYSPEVTVFSAEALALSKSIDSMLERYDMSEVGVIVMSFDEASHLFNSATDYDNLSTIPWIGTEGVTGSHTITGDERASEFAEATGLMALQFSTSDNQQFVDVRAEYEERAGSPPNNNYVYASYDSLWALGLALDEVGLDVDDLKEQFPKTVDAYTGTLGDTKLNDAGDLAITDYEFLTVANSEWVPAARYDASSGTIIDY